MNKLILFLLCLATIVSAQSLNGIKICIDPGHGGHDTANDRFISSTGFWESDGNWGKAKFTKEVLESLGAEVILTRKGNDDSDDLGLSVRAAIANSNNVDYFHSIHSNGYQGNSNYSLLLFNGTDTSPSFTEAKTMSSIMVNEIQKAHRTSDQYVRADRSFLGFNLGVLRPLTMPGTLSEGSFHDYIPESWRLMNSVYRKHEAIAIAKAFLKYFNAGSLTTGEIAGVLRDPELDVDYFAISGTNDKKQPLNNIKVVLKPGNIEYNGDDLNNGFYLFDNLTPGNYKLIFTAEDYSIDSTEVTVTANNSAFKDFYLDLVPNLEIPNVLSVSPKNNEEFISLSDKIKINFSIQMNKSSVENSFSITPSISGKFEWSNNNKTVSFTPSTNFNSATTYEVKIDNSAQSRFNISIPEVYHSKFITRKILRILDTYPTNQENDISSTVKVVLTFDAEIDPSTLPGNIEILDENNTFPNINVDLTAYENRQIIFYPLDKLSESMKYDVNLKSGISDIEGLSLGMDTTISFIVGSEKFSTGNIFDDFEDNNWVSPSNIIGSKGIVESETKFEIQKNIINSGIYAGYLQYQFNSDTGNCKLKFSQNLKLKPNQNDILEFWVYGDLSNNLLEIALDDNGVEEYLFLDTLNWTGWKLKTLEIPDNYLGKDISFIGLDVIKTKTSGMAGELFFDDFGFTGTITNVKSINVLKEYNISQNFPNPFNPTTTIRITIPNNRQDKVSRLMVYNSLGEEVVELVNRKLGKGVHEFNFNGENLSSGVYFYRFSNGDFTSIKKMLLLK